MKGSYGVNLKDTTLLGKLDFELNELGTWDRVEGLRDCAPGVTPILYDCYLIALFFESAIQLR